MRSWPSWRNTGDLVTARTPALMVLGTASHAGKSLVTTALCRIFSDLGIAVAPFKAQNMSLNSAATPDGLEIGRAQALQAEAARRAPSVDMNPILLKPSGDSRTQIVLEGRILEDTDAWTYHTRRTRELFARVVAAYERLAATSDLIVLEGAGSPAEVNLRDGDIVNMRMAQAAGAACMLIADIDRGGALAAVVGTLALLEPHERERIAGFAFNKFRGDVSLLRPGIATIEARTGLPCLGVIPWLHDLHLDEEDSYGRERTRAPWPAREGATGVLRIAVVDLPLLSNATDAEALAAEPAVAVRWVTDALALQDADVLVLPGSKGTAADLRWLRARGLTEAIRQFAQTRPVIGICGGLQMLGYALDDPHGVEGGGSERGIGLLPVDTVLTRLKTTVRTRGTLTAVHWCGAASHAQSFSGYEIHTGESTRSHGAPFSQIEREGERTSAPDGAVSADGRVCGTYVHGLFDDDAFRHATLAALRQYCGLAPAQRTVMYRAEREARIDRWAAHVAAALDVPALLRYARHEART